MTTPGTFIAYQLRQEYPPGVLYGYRVLLDATLDAGNFAVSGNTLVAANNLINNARVRVTGVLSEGVDYWVRDRTPTGFSLSATRAGDVLPISGTAGTYTEQPLTASDDIAVLIRHELTHPDYARQGFTPGEPISREYAAILPTSGATYSVAPTNSAMTFRYQVLLWQGRASKGDTTGTVAQFDDFGTQTISPGQSITANLIIERDSAAGSISSTETATVITLGNITRLTYQDNPTVALYTKDGSLALDFGIPQGSPGVSPVLGIGTVTSGTTAGASIDNTIPLTPKLNLTLPKGDTGASPVLGIGTVTSGTTANASIDNTTPLTPKLNLTLPKGDTGASPTLSIGNVTSGNINANIRQGSIPTTYLLDLSLPAGVPGSVSAAGGLVLTSAPAPVTDSASIALWNDGGTVKLRDSNNGASSALAVLTKSQAFTKAQGTALYTLTYAATITPDFSQSNVFKCVLTGACALANATNLVPGFAYTLILQQDGTGNRTATWGSAFKFPANTPPTLSTGVGLRDVLSFICDGADLLFCGIQKGL